MLSMTGFGRGEKAENGRQFEVEVKTVNHRYLDINLRLPRTMAALEEGVRQTIKRTLKRGRVDVFVNFRDTSQEGTSMVVNQSLLENYLTCFKEVEKNYGIQNDITMATLVKTQDVFMPEERKQDEEFLATMLNGAVAQALKTVQTMRATEGEKMRSDILSRGARINELIEQVEERAPQVVVEYKEKLEKRLDELLNDIAVDETKLAAEVAFIADRTCVAEETIRLKSHIQQMREFCEAKEPVGRKLDFLVQEMNREANTIGSKANDLELTNIVVEIKSEIEKIREQVQNIE